MRSVDLKQTNKEEHNEKQNQTNKKQNKTKQNKNSQMIMMHDT